MVYRLFKAVCAFALLVQVTLPQAAAQTTPASHVTRLVRDGGVQVEVLIDGAGPTMVLLPSAQRDSLDFDELTGELVRAGYRVLRPQPRGVGGSQGPMDPLTLNDLANDVALALRQLGVGKAVVIGHAYGHFVARVLDKNHPELVRGIVVAGAASKTYPASLVQSLYIASDSKQPEALRRQHLQSAFFAPGSDPGAWLTGWHPQLREPYRKAATVPPKDDWWTVSNSPILDLQGADDPWRPAATTQELRDQLGDKVTVKRIARASHALVPEQPKAVASAIIEWVATLPR
ncbi:alpha/beta hydrolase [uncultured Hydrogenophaga sp.]|uniref:alpha/beta fold hydrolase n=1 Tax=uncultured Hydrogenophaga sp. TaxID=199683 RepID=UPI00258BE8F9|nr:alpha/beta hydrolase [uncultured Hydrogenophaga sp.]